jgi:retinol-binding protein 3
MVRRLRLILMMLVSAGPAMGQVAIPNTPAGKALTAWLDAFNSGDRAKIDTFLQKYSPKVAEAALTSPQFRGRSGGVDLVAVTRNEPLSMAFRVQEKTQPTVLMVGRIDVTDQVPTAISNFTLHPIPTGAVLEDIKLDPALRKQALENVIATLNEFYVYPATAQKMADNLHEHENKGDYSTITDGDEFASRLSSDLIDVSHDKHVRVFYYPYKLGTDPPPLTFDQLTEYRKDMARDCGFHKLEILPNNIGYLKLDFFANPQACAKTAAAAIYFLANTDAVIFDLRENSGGEPAMVATMCTYLFDQPTLLNDFYDRKGNTTTEFWTLRYVPGIKLGNKPVYVLTSKQTFSGGEEFAYDLKNLKRVTVVGETTAGGSHPVGPHRAGDHFVVFVPSTLILNPVTRQDWEGTGVTPDVAVKAEDALETAERLAAERIQQDASHDAGAAPNQVKPQMNGIANKN